MEGMTAAFRLVSFRKKNLPVLATRLRSPGDIRRLYGDGHSYVTLFHFLSIPVNHHRFHIFGNSCIFSFKKAGYSYINLISNLDLGQCTHEYGMQAILLR